MYSPFLFYFGALHLRLIHELISKNSSVLCTWDYSQIEIFTLNFLHFTKSVLHSYINNEKELELPN